MACKKWYMGTNTKMYKTIAETNEFVSRLCELTGDIGREDFRAVRYSELYNTRSSEQKPRSGASQAWCTEYVLGGAWSVYR